MLLKENASQNFVVLKLSQIITLLFVVVLIIGGCSTDDSNQENFILYAPGLSTETYLFDSTYNVVHRWPSVYNALSAFLLEDGSIVRGGSINDVDPDNRFVEAYRDGFNTTFQIGGIVEHISKDGEVV